MTQEEKAKRYDEALEEAKRWHKAFVVGHNYPATDIKVSYEWMFPELKKSEDERIRKDLMEWFEEFPDSVWRGHHKKDIIAWLEKQETSINKVEPKFHEGEWITNGDYTWKIVEVKPLDYILQSQDGNIVDDTISHVDEQFHSFTIEDAKDGDVLFHSDSASNGIFLFKEIRHDGKVLCYCDYDSEDHFCLGEHHTCCWVDAKILRPATKKQCDHLFTKMKEAGYEWDAEKKELKEIIDEKQIIDNIIDYMKPMPIFFESTKGKSGKEYTKEFVKEAIKWLEYLKERYAWKPSDEQIGVIEAVINNRSFQRRHLDSLYEQLKKLRGK